MNTLSRSKIKPRICWSCQIKLFSAITNAQPEDWTPREQKYVFRDATFLEIAKLHKTMQLSSINRTLNHAKASHSRSICFGLQDDVTTSNILIRTYSECGLISLARQVFDKMPERSSISWNTMMGTYTKKGMEQEAFELFFQMQKEGVKFNEFTLPTVLSACRANLDVLECKQLHAYAIKTCMDKNVFVSTGMLDLYAKCGFILDAIDVFESMIERGSVTWSSMVAGYVLNKVYEGALLLFREAQIIGQEQNEYTLSSVLCACANLAALIEGKQIHAILSKTGFDSYLHMVASLIEMYSKCGSIREASTVFSNLEEKNDVVWNAMISAFGKHGRSMEVMILFEKMQQSGVNPSEATFTSLLSACGHMGLVEKGQTFFQLMETERGLTPNVVHYSCMVDTFCRAGHLSKAYELVESMPFTPTASIWGSLLSSCRVYGNLQLAEIAAKKLLELEPENAGNHVLMSNVYAANRKWDEVAQSRKTLKESEAKKVRGKSWIEIKDKVHVFAVGDREHSRILEIYKKLDDLLKVLKIFGYEPAVEHELHDVEESKKMELLRHHSEKIAFVFGLMSLPSGVPIRIMKNLRICVDCHAFMKVASRVMGREIVVRDVNRFHHFRDGSCSCGEFW